MSTDASQRDPKLESEARAAVERLLARGPPAEIEAAFAGVIGALHDPESVAAGLARALGRPVDPGLSLEPPSDRAPGERAETPAAEVRPRRARSPYRILGEIARGGMGVIHSVWDSDLRRSMAMKTLPHADGVAVAEHDRERAAALAQRFLAEAQVTGQLDHPGIVPVHELGLDSAGRAYFTMRWVRGEDLGQVFRKARADQAGWTPTRTLGVLLRVCEAVAYAHSKGVVHRDLKPANVMVGRFGEVYVMDWGLAKVLGQPDPRDLRLRDLGRTTFVSTDVSGLSEDGPDRALETLDGAVLGTPAYMSPEQARGEIDLLDRRSDVYAIGAMLYELCAGRAPYVPESGRASARTILVAVLGGPPAPLHQLAPGVPAELVAIAEKAMAREREQRYASTLELAEDLRAYLEGRVVAAYETGALAELRKWVRRNRAVASLAACVALVALGGLGAVGWVERRGRLEVLRLADAKLARELAAEAETLWPIWPERLEAMRSWQARVAELALRLPRHERELAELRAQGAEAAGAGGTPTWSFASNEQAWRHEVLSELVAGVRALGSSRDGLAADVERRVALAEGIVDATVLGRESGRAQLWRESCAIAADVARAPRYGGLALDPQVGLVPLGLDPESGLLEFAVWGSGGIPERDADGWLSLDEKSAIVLVLLPGGRFRMGDASDGADPRSRAEERPCLERELSAFFVGKHELTQAQWLRIAGDEPSYYRAGGSYGERPVGGIHPVESVGARRCEQVLGRFGLILPTEAQWEYAARSGSETAWWSGAEPASVTGAGNLADRALVRVDPAYERYTTELPDLDDGWAFHAPVGSYEANGFGLHDVIGNVQEWCRDGLAAYSEPAGHGDGFRAGGGPEIRMLRGGAWNRGPSLARSAARLAENAENATSSLGVRAARAVLALPPDLRERW